jgi:hypothetical protein
MFKVFTPLLRKKKEERPETSRDFYFINLEEAYGNLPVPTDDWADIENLLKRKNIDFDKDELENAIEVIRQHYEDVALALGKEQKFG